MTSGVSSAHARGRRAGTRGGTRSHLDALAVLNPVMHRHAPDDVRAELAAVMARHGLRYRVVSIAESADLRAVVARRIAAALRQGCRRVIAIGGDGTVALVADALARGGAARPRPVLAIVPAGTANVLAGELGLPTGLGDALELAAAGGGTLDLDLIAGEERAFTTQVGIGPDALMIRDTSRNQQARLGRLAYMRQFVRHALGYRPARLTLEIDGETHRLRAWQVVVANVGSVGAPPFTWGPGIDPTDGVLDVCVFDVRSVLDYVRHVWRVVRGRHRPGATARYFHVRERLTIHADRSLLVQGDGDVTGRTPVTLRPLPGAVRVVVPRVAPEPPTSAAGHAETQGVQHDVETMLAERSRTWVLQGVFRHPLAGLAAFDAALFLRVNAIPLGTVTDRVLTWISRVMHYGEGWAAVALGLVIVDRGAGVRAIAEALPVLWLTMLTVNFPLKRLFRRRRPFNAFVKARVVGPKPRDYSFPSGHTAAAFGGAVVFGAHAPAGAPAFYALAVVVGFSRVYLGVHYPSDVVIGAIVGTALAVAYRALLHLVAPGLAP